MYIYIYIHIYIHLFFNSIVFITFKSNKCGEGRGREGRFAVETELEPALGFRIQGRPASELKWNELKNGGLWLSRT